MAIITDFITTFIICGTAYLGVLSRNFNYVQDSALIGLALNQVFGIAMLAQTSLRTFSETENMMNSLTRMK